MDADRWQPLAAVEEPVFYRGAVFRFPAQHPFEAVVDFMLIEDWGSPAGYRLICSTGYHAGQTELVLPEAAKYPQGGIAVAWLRDHWREWVYEHCGAEEVIYLANYPPNI